MRLVPVSAVIVVRNGARFISEALRSIYAQTWVPEEVIVVDDGSTDKTYDEVQRFPTVIYERQPPLGVAAARNRGVELVSRPILGFLDADDIWMPSKTQLQLEILSASPKIDLVSGLVVQFTGSSPDDIRIVSAPAAANLTGTQLIRRHAFERVGAYSSAVPLGEMIEWWGRAQDIGLHAHPLDALVLMRRLHDGNMGRTVKEPMRKYLHILHGIVMRRRSVSRAKS